MTGHVEVEPSSRAGCASPKVQLVLAVIQKNGSVTLMTAVGFFLNIYILGFADEKGYLNEYFVLHTILYLKNLILKAIWGAWTAWSRCHKSCGEGIRWQTRQCQASGAECEGRTSKTEICNIQICRELS